MPSTDIDGSPTLMIGVEDARQIRTMLMNIKTGIGPESPSLWEYHNPDSLTIKVKRFLDSVES